MRFSCRDRALIFEFKMQIRNHAMDDVVWELKYFFLFFSLSLFSKRAIHRLLDVFSSDNFFVVFVFGCVRISFSLSHVLRPTVMQFHFCICFLSVAFEMMRDARVVFDQLNRYELELGNLQFRFRKCLRTFSVVTSEIRLVAKAGEREKCSQCTCTGTHKFDSRDMVLSKNHKKHERMKRIEDAHREWKRQTERGHDIKQWMRGKSRSSTSEKENATRSDNRELFNVTQNNTQHQANFLV